MCPHCGSSTLTWVHPAGSGTVYSTTVVRRKADQGGDYNIVLVDLEEGVRMMGRVTGVTAEAVRIGDGVQLEVGAGEDGEIVLFRMAGGAS